MLIAALAFVCGNVLHFVQHNAFGWLRIKTWTLWRYLSLLLSLI